MKLFLSLINKDIIDLDFIVDQFDSLLDGYHIDVMDGVFVPTVNESILLFDEMLIRTRKKLWLHCMTIDPLMYLDGINDLSGAIVTVHVELKKNIKKILLSIKKKQGRPSLAISPKTSISYLESYLDCVDHILVMTVNPGYSGQKFIPDSIDRIKRIKALCKQYNKDEITFAADGGISFDASMQLKEAGIAEIAFSNVVFSCPTTEDQKNALKKLDQIRQ